MAGSQETFSKKEKEKKRLRKRKEKQQKMEERKANPKSSDLDSMIAYVDENGNITDTPPDPSKKQKVKAESIELGIPKREEGDVDPVRNGKIDFFNDSKGFGFISDTETRERFFVHANGLMQQVQEGDKVTFELERGMKGMNAVKVKKV